MTSSDLRRASAPLPQRERLYTLSSPGTERAPSVDREKRKRGPRYSAVSFPPEKDEREDIEDVVDFWEVKEDERGSMEEREEEGEVGGVQWGEGTGSDEDELDARPLARSNSPGSSIDESEWNILEDDEGSWTGLGPPSDEEENADRLQLQSLKLGWEREESDESLFVLSLV